MTVTDVVANAYRRALPTILVSAVGGLLAGVVLGGMDAELAAVDGLLVMIPAFLAIRGSVYGSFGSRLSTALHQGLVEPTVEYDPAVASAIVAALSNGVAASLIAAVLAYGILSTVGRPVASLWTLAVIAVVGGVLAGIALTVVVVVVVAVGYRRGLNPYDLVGPATTTAGDVFGMGSLYVATKVALAIS